MLSFVKRFFQRRSQLKVGSLENFVDAVKSQSCTAVTVKPWMTNHGGANTKEFGIVGDFLYLLEFASETPTGRTVVYRERLFKRAGSERGPLEEKDRNKAAIRTVLLGEQKAGELRTKLPAISVRVLDKESRPISEAMFADLRRQAEACGVYV